MAPDCRMARGSVPARGTASPCPTRVDAQPYLPGVRLSPQPARTGVPAKYFRRARSERCSFGRGLGQAALTVGGEMDGLARSAARLVDP